LLEKLRAGVILGVANNLDAATALGDHIAFRHGLGSIVGSLGVDIRAQLANQSADIGL
jgi:hypothetical protein